MLKLWQLLLAFLTLGVAEGEEAGGEEGGGEGGEAETGGEEPGSEGSELPADDLDSLIESVEGDQGGEENAGGKQNASIREMRRRTQEAEAARIRAEAQLEEARRGRQQPPQASEEQRLYE